MPGSARLTSIEALDTFRAALIVYREKAGRIVEDLGQDVVRTRIWLETDRAAHWDRQVRLRAAAEAQAQQELLTARLAQDPGAVQERRKALERAQRARQEAEGKRDRVRHWLRRYPTDVEAQAYTLRRLQHLLAYDLGKAVSFLETAAATLADYAALAPASAAPVPPSPAPADGSPTPDLPPAGSEATRGGVA